MSFSSIFKFFKKWFKFQITKIIDYNVLKVILDFFKFIRSISNFFTHNVLKVYYINKPNI
jgi:hypothetical protein